MLYFIIPIKFCFTFILYSYFSLIIESLINIIVGNFLCVYHNYFEIFLFYHHLPFVVFVKLIYQYIHNTYVLFKYIIYSFVVGFSHIFYL